MRDQSLYELLQVSENTDQEIIQAAYRRLILRYHPDRSSEPNAAEMTQRLNDAYEIPSEPTRRADYDRGIKGRTSRSSIEEDRPNTPPPPPKTRPPRRAPTPPRRTRVDCPHCKQSVIPTKVDAFDWITFFVWGWLTSRRREKASMCSNCGKSLPANLLGS
jgi:curved DNA-binding protein CbpA